MSAYLLVIGSLLLAVVAEILQIVFLPLLALAYIGRCGKALAQAWCIQMIALFAPLVVPFITNRSGPSIRWFWFNTPDDQGQTQGMYEPQVKSVYDTIGWKWKTFYWLACRNVCYGLANRFRPDYDMDSAQFIANGNKLVMTWITGEVSEYTYHIPVFSKTLTIAFGHKIHVYVGNKNIDTNPNTDTGGVPYFTVRLR